MHPVSAVFPAVQIKEIVKLAPKKRQTLLFSATMTEQVQQLITMSLKSPVRLAADAAGRAPEELRQEIVRLKVHTHTHARLPHEVRLKDRLCV